MVEETLEVVADIDVDVVGELVDEVEGIELEEVGSELVVVVPAAGTVYVTSLEKPLALLL